MTPSHLTNTPDLVTLAREAIAARAEDPDKPESWTSLIARGRFTAAATPEAILALAGV